MPDNIPNALGAVYLVIPYNLLVITLPQIGTTVVGLTRVFGTEGGYDSKVHPEPRRQP
jgi:hypothetical protein